MLSPVPFPPPLQTHTPPPACTRPLLMLVREAQQGPAFPGRAAVGGAAGGGLNPPWHPALHPHTQLSVSKPQALFLPRLGHGFRGNGTPTGPVLVGCYTVTQSGKQAQRGLTGAFVPSPSSLLQHYKSSILPPREYSVPLALPDMQDTSWNWAGPAPEDSCVLIRVLELKFPRDTGAGIFLR